MNSMLQSVYNCLDETTPKTAFMISREANISIPSARKYLRHLAILKEATMIGKVRTSGLSAPAYILGNGVDYVPKPEVPKKPRPDYLVAAFFGDYRPDFNILDLYQGNESQSGS